MRADMNGGNISRVDPVLYAKVERRFNARLGMAAGGIHLVIGIADGVDLAKVTADILDINGFPTASRKGRLDLRAP